MMNINKKILVFSLILIFGLTIAGEVLAVSWLPLVPCGRSGQEKCTFCDILHLFKNVFDFLSFEVTPALAAVMVAVAGFYILTAGDSTTRLETGKTILKSVVFSLLIIYASWLVINTALTIFAKPTGGGGFFSFDCKAPPTPGTLNNTPNPSTSANPSTTPTPTAPSCTANPATLDDNNKATTFTVSGDKVSGCTWGQLPSGATYTNGTPSGCSAGITFADKTGGTVSVTVKDDKQNNLGTASCKVGSAASSGCKWISDDCSQCSSRYASPVCVPITGINTSSVCAGTYLDCPYMNPSGANIGNQAIADAIKYGGVVTGALGHHGHTSNHDTGCAIDFSGFSQSAACSFMAAADKYSTFVNNEYGFNCPGHTANCRSGCTGGHVHVKIC